MLIHPTREEYESSRKSVMHFSALKVFMDCPKTFYLQRTGVLPAPDTDSLRIGTGLNDLLLLGEDEYLKNHKIGGPINPRTGQPYGTDTKAFAEWSAENPGRYLTSIQDSIVRKMKNALVHYGSVASDLEARIGAEMAFDSVMNGVRCWAKIDLVVKGRLIDIKTTADIDKFERMARVYRYPHQMAFYLAASADHFNDPYMTCELLAVESRPPYRVGRWVITPKMIELAQSEISAALDEYRGCELLGPQGFNDRYGLPRMLDVYRTPDPSLIETPTDEEAEEVL
jgi:hypothetical protein